LGFKCDAIPIFDANLVYLDTLLDESDPFELTGLNIPGPANDNVDPLLNTPELVFKLKSSSSSLAARGRQTLLDLVRVPTSRQAQLARQTL